MEPPLYNAKESSYYGTSECEIAKQHTAFVDDPKSAPQSTTIAGPITLVNGRPSTNPSVPGQSDGRLKSEDLTHEMRATRQDQKNNQAVTQAMFHLYFSLSRLTSEVHSAYPYYIQQLKLAYEQDPMSISNHITKVIARTDFILKGFESTNHAVQTCRCDPKNIRSVEEKARVKSQFKWLVERFALQIKKATVTITYIQTQIKERASTLDEAVNNGTRPVDELEQTFSLLEQVYNACHTLQLHQVTLKNMFKTMVKSQEDFAAVGINQKRSSGGGHDDTSSVNAEMDLDDEGEGSFA
ncbi:hypothetical protein CANARDRAFT_24152 [[Candida] arabinofermentans NRRL YB-2248]|uniref:Uncharacterized protein n=1 Tax=[Candida] arabinofermentans NRRL YB-2248 TaxID=983967 RepID=A0A1E4SY01_9ASCO|nr:hypothetical protein CANARDRAFT_24152 [[Candida] arabinofermentans NRRL YB-2248]